MEQNKEISYRQILGVADYRKLIFSNVVNRFGDSIAFTWIVYQITHSAAWSAIVFGVNFLPNVVVQPFAGATAAMCIDIVTFVVTATLIGLMKSGSKAFWESSNNKAGNSEESIIRIFKDGIAYTAKTPVVRNLCILCVVLNFMLVPINALQAPIASEILKTGAEILSFAGVFSALGGIAGSALLPVLSRRLSPLRITCLGTAALGIGLLGIPCGGVFVGNRTACYITMSICFFVLTIAASLIGGVLGIQFMKSVDQEYMARASAVFDATSTVAMPIGSFGISALVAYMSTSNIMIFSAVFSAAVLLALVLMKPELEKREVETPNAA